MKDNAFSITAYAPVIRQSVDSYSETLATQRESYTVTRNVGFDVASFELTGPPDYLWEWFSGGLVRHVEWSDPDGGVAWEGFVNRLTFSAGGNARVRAIDGMANRVLCVYTPLDTTQTPPTAGAQTTVTKNDAPSQALYGIKIAIVSGGECTAATADCLASSTLSRLKIIPVDETITVGAGRESSLAVEMLGYAHMADWWTYTQTASSGTADADAVVSAVLAADPNGVLSTSTVNIDPCATAINQYWDGQQTGWKIVQDIAGRGQVVDSVGYEWTCGVYERRRTTFKAAESVNDAGVALASNKRAALHRHAFDAGDQFVDDAGREAMPWELRPDRLVYTAGLPGHPMYVTQVRYTLPIGVTLTGTDARLNPLRMVLSEGCG